MPLILTSRARPGSASPLVAALGAGLLIAPLAGCSAVKGDTNDSAAGNGSCPTEPVRVVVTVDQWGDIVDRLGGDCADVTTVITGSSADPHDYEPTPSDAAAFEGAQLVVRNGLDYDPWADRAIATLDSRPNIVDAGDLAGRKDGDNPHVWYSPDAVQAVATAVTEHLQRLAPGAASVFAAHQATWRTSLAPYEQEIATVTRLAAGKSYAATEPVFDDMANAVGLEPRTPAGYRRAALNESDPSPGDVAAFQRALRNGEIDVLIDNTQTEGSTTDEIRRTADTADVPVVEVTETVPPGTTSFVEWQVRQLKALAAALEP